MPAPDIKTHEDSLCFPPRPTRQPSEIATEDVCFEEASLADWKTKRRQPCTPEKCLAGIRAYEAFCQEAGRKPWSGGYREWEKTQPDAPSWGSIIKYLGSWNQARRQAARDCDHVTINPVGYPHSQKRGRVWTPEKCLAALRLYEEHCQQAGTKPLSADYEVWRKSRNAPSIFTLCRVLRSWNHARRSAAKNGSDVVLYERGGKPLKRSRPPHNKNAP